MTAMAAVATVTAMTTVVFVTAVLLVVTVPFVGAVVRGGIVLCRRVRGHVLSIYPMGV